MFSLQIYTDNAAFSEGNKNAEVARILRTLADNLYSENHEGGKLFDVNGNTVGRYRFHK